MKRILYIFAIALAAAACAKDDGMLSADEIGVLDEAPTVGCIAYVTMKIASLCVKSLSGFQADTC